MKQAKPTRGVIRFSLLLWVILYSVDSILLTNLIKNKLKEGE